ncbi:uncharacterized protein [Littorina saxatilis]|uniref:uncharacterized protein isoform X2 n=1 Tax=Littorina saxatilis TaxID=31220 RepID=UPI0038B59DAB
MAALEKLFQESYRPTDQREVVGNYVLGPILGQGRSSLVRCAVDLKHRQKFAVKAIVRTVGVKGKQLEKQFRQEAKVLMLVRHPHIVTMIEVLETSRYLYVVMEMVAGRTLRSVLKDRSCFPEETVRDMTRQITGALHHLHNTAGVVHRDLKPANIMMCTATSQLKLIDLGLSSSLSDGPPRGQCGSPVYMAPELLRAQQHGPPRGQCGSPVYMAPELLRAQQHGPPRGQCGSPVYMAPELLRAQQHGPPRGQCGSPVYMAPELLRAQQHGPPRGQCGSPVYMAPELLRAQQHGPPRGQCGSPVYMAPELLRAQQHGPPVDMWSLGVLVCELLTGQRPFQPERRSSQLVKNMAAVYSQIIKKACWDICHGISISPDGADFLRGLMQMEESKRLTSQDAVKHKWLAS